MTVAVMKTRAEQALAEQFETAAPKLPGGAAVTKLRRSAFEIFAKLGLPHRRIEAWKYTDLRTAMKEAVPLGDAGHIPVSQASVAAALGPWVNVDAWRIVLVNGAYRAELSNLTGVDGIEAAPLSENFARLNADTSDAVAALNTAFATDGVLIDIPAHAAPAKPVLIVALTAGSAPSRITLRHVIKAGAGSKATIVELYHALPGAADAGEVNTLTEVTVGAGATLSHVKAAGHGLKATHLSNWQITLAAKAHYRGFQMTSDTALARNQLLITYTGEGGKLDLSGVFLGRGGDHIDTTLTVDHAVPHCESRELFAGVLDGRARGIFQGKIIVRPDAQKTDGKQMARALMLSPDAEFDSKPELEIYADDVVCGHGSTAAQLDEDQLFYCLSRGIPEPEARALLIESFIGEAMAKVEHVGVQDALMDSARAWLKAGAGHGDTARGKG